MAKMRTRAQHLAIIGASLVAGAFEAAHQLAWTGRFAGYPIAFEVIGMIVELELLTVLLERGLARRRSTMATFGAASVAAIGWGIASGFGVGWVQAALGMHGGGAGMSSAAVTAQVGAFDGLVGLGLWAMAIAVPQLMREATARALESDRLHTIAELARLRAHLQPHFLFNTLNTIAGLVTEEPRTARELIGALGELLRDSLEDSAETHALVDEVAWLKRYAAILETRHRGSLRFAWRIEAAAHGLRVPRLLLQPLLENATHHGALRRRDGGEVSIHAAVDAGILTCVVEDNGPGPADAKPRDGAHGIALVVRRLELEYDGAATFRLERSGACTRAIVELPARLS